MSQKQLISNIRYLRSRKKFSQQQVADIIGSTRPLVDHWENNRSLPQTDELHNLSMLFGLIV